MNQKRISDIKVIGRSRINVDAYEYNPKYYINYERIKISVDNFILKNKISILPIDVVNIALNNGWVVIPYSKMETSIKNIFEEIMHTDWGFTIFNENKYMIFYNDSISISSQRFTIAHEIGHIYLGHFVYSNPIVREIEANIFASMLLMPISVLEECNVCSVEEIKFTCGVSHKAALRRFKIFKRKKYMKLPIDYLVKKNFDKYIENYKIRQKSV